ncbi:MAG TPA: adenylyl-sulfate kinase [Solirubrobacteraceae bacterium]|nr:adenylyl-sulfate kinase [Solirubrobacteraceae bacterium]
MAQAPLRHLSSAAPPASNVCWHEGNLDRAARWQHLGQRGATIWFTGLSGSGKSTVAAAVEQCLVESHRWAYRLDGDNLRHGVCSDLGFSRDDRAENARRVAELALLFADSGSVALVCLVSPYAADRRCARALHEDAGIEFVEVFVNTSIEECVRRDVKGLYAKARGGALANLTGVGSPYEPPAAPDVELTEALDVATAAARVLQALPPVRA